MTGDALGFDQAAILRFGHHVHGTAHSRGPVVVLHLVEQEDVDVVHAEFLAVAVEVGLDGFDGCETGLGEDDRLFARNRLESFAGRVWLPYWSAECQKFTPWSYAARKKFGHAQVSQLPGAGWNCRRVPVPIAKPAQLDLARAEGDAVGRVLANGTGEKMVRELLERDRARGCGFQKRVAGSCPTGRITRHRSGRLWQEGPG